MPRRRQVSDAQIVRAARKIFLEHGTQVPVSVIAKELGVSPAAVFVRMGTKSRLISAALWPPDPPVLALLETGAIEEAQFERRLIDIVVDIAVYTESEIPATFTLYAAGLRAKPSDDFSDVTPARLRRALTKRLREAVDAALIRCDPRMAAELIIGTLEARAMHAFLAKRAAPRRDTREFVRRLVATAIGRPLVTKDSVSS